MPRATNKFSSDAPTRHIIENSASCTDIGDGLLVFFVGVVLFRVAAAVYFLTHLLVAAAPVVMLASRIAIAMTDWTPITTKGLWYGFDYKACIAAVNSAAGGLTVAAVLKYADAVLKGYATAISVLLTGVLSMVLFSTELSVEYALGMTNVLAAVFLYNAQDLEKHAW